MEKFKGTIKKRITIACIYNAVILMLLASGIFHLVTGSNKNVSDFISGFNMGACVGVQTVMLYFMGKYIGAVKHEEKLRQLYILENDERRIFIYTKSGGTAIHIVICGLALGTIISGYRNEIAFFTLLGATVFSALITLTLKIYYNKKI